MVLSSSITTINFLNWNGSQSLMMEIQKKIIKMILIAFAVGIVTILWLLVKIEFLRFFSKQEKTIKVIQNDIPSPRGYPIVGHALEMKKNKEGQLMEKWAYIHGPIYKLNLMGKIFHVISDLESIFHVFKSRPQEFTRGPIMESVFSELNAMGLFSEEGEDWKRSRQLVTPAFAPNRVLDMRPSIVKHVLELKQNILKFSKGQNDLLTQMKSVNSNGFAWNPEKMNLEDSLDLLPTLRMTILKIMIEVGFSWGHEDLVSFDLLKGIGVFMEVLADRIFAAIPVWKIYKTEKDVKAVNTINELYKVIDKIMKLMDESEDDFAETVAVNGVPSVTQRTLLHSLMLARKTSKIDSKVPYMSDQQIKGNILHMIAASYGKRPSSKLEILKPARYLCLDTTPVTIYWALDMLARYPDLQEKAYEEVHSVLGHVKDWTSANTISLLENLETKDFPFLECFLQETMRHRPVGTAFFATNLKAFRVCGYEIDSGSNLILLPRCAGIKKFIAGEDPTKFNPKLWEISNSSDSDTFQRQTLLAQSTSFGSGPRICPGRHLAMQEMILILAVVFLSDYKINHFPKPPGHDIVEELTLFVNTPENLHIHLVPR